jgi:hypothetical protein
LSDNTQNHFTSQDGNEVQGKIIFKIKKSKQFSHFSKLLQAHKCYALALLLLAVAKLQVSQHEKWN